MQRPRAPGRRAGPVGPRGWSVRRAGEEAAKPGPRALCPELGGGAPWAGSLGVLGANLRCPSVHSYRTLATEHEALMQKYLHLLQIVETEKTVATQLRRQIEDGEIEIERLKAEVTAGWARRGPAGVQAPDRHLRAPWAPAGGAGRGAAGRSPDVDPAMQAEREGRVVGSGFESHLCH